METLDPTLPKDATFGWDDPPDAGMVQPEMAQSSQQSNDEETHSEDELALVKQWQDKIIRAKRFWEDDFKRMRENMRFVSGLQWPGQARVQIDKYVNNIALRMVNQKVASLYAKNPTFVAQPIERLNYTIWDGEMESLLEAGQMAQQILSTGQPLPPELSMFFADIEAGKMRELLVKKVGDSMTKVFNYSIRSQKPEFKQQLKQVVRRAVICCVGFGRPVFCKDGSGYTQPSSIEHKSGQTELAARAQEILKEQQEGEVDESSATIGTLKSLALSLQTQGAQFNLPERLDFDFPTATSVIVDPSCRSLVDFVGASWIAQEYCLPVEEVNSIFGVDIEVGTGNSANEVNPATADSSLVNGLDNKSAFFEKKKVTLWEVFDKNTETRFFICDGWKNYVLPPEVPTPSVSGFWPIFALLFNEMEVAEDDDNGARTSPYPPSDVQTIVSAQREWNRTREDLRDQRRANAPVWMCRKGMLTAGDKEKIANAVPNEVIELEGIPPDMPLEKFFVRRPVAPIDPAMYDTAPLEQDIMLGGGMQQANIGPAQPNVTATVGSIAEQSRLNVSASNIDDLDGFLSRLAQAGGEMLLQAMSVQTVKQIAGDGAVWPDQPETRAQFLNEVFLNIEAASSGRPNKAIDIANWRDLAPLMLQAGANPIGVVNETAKRLDDTMDPTKFFPLLPPGGSLSPSPEGSSPDQANSTGNSESNGSSTNPVSPAPAMVGGNDGGASNAQVPTVS